MGDVVLRVVVACALCCVSHLAILAGRAGGLRSVRPGDAREAASAVAIGIALACAVAVPARQRMEACAESLASSPVSSWEFVVAGDPSAGEWSWTCVAEAYRDGTARGRVLLSCDDQLARGQRLRSVGHFSAAGDDDWGRSCWERGICGSVRVVRVMLAEEDAGTLGAVMGLRAAVVSRVRPATGEARALMVGVVLGQRSALGELGVDEDFSRSGLAHLVAVSGTHIALVTAALSKLLERREAPLAVRVTMLAGVGWAYVLLCGAPASAVRAWCMSVAGWGSALAGRRAHALSAVAVTGCALCVLWPGTAGELGFALSVVCVGGLCLFGRYAEYALSVVMPCELPHVLPRRLRRRLAHIAHGVRGGLASAMVAQLCSTPLVAVTFGCVSLVGPLASLVAGPLFEACMGVGLAAVVLCWVPVLGDALLRASDACFGTLLLVARTMGRLPMAVSYVERPWLVGVVVAAGILALLVWWPDVRVRSARRAVAVVAGVALCWQLGWAVLAPARVVVLDVGQGDAILVQDGPHSLLVDAGPDEAVARALLRNHVRHLDAVLVTHLHDDHYGGISSLVGVTGVDSVMVASGTQDGARNVLGDALDDLGLSDVLTVSYGDVLRIGRFSCRVVWPCGDVAGTQNADSVELLVSFDDGSESLVALLTGDAEHDQTSAVLASGDVGDVDLLKVGHHGSEASLDAADARELRAEVAVASAGADNPYGHPSEECTETLSDAGSLFLCTRDVGDVDVRPGRHGPVVRTHRGEV